MTKRHARLVYTAFILANMPVFYTPSVRSRFLAHRFDDSVFYDKAVAIAPSPLSSKDFFDH